MLGIIAGGRKREQLLNSIELIKSPAINRRGAVNAYLASLIGALLNAADTFLNPLIVLPLFALKVSASLHSIALISATGAVSWFAALLCGSAIGRLIPRQQVANIIAAVFRAGAIALLAYELSHGSTRNSDRLHLFFLCYVVYSAARGLSREPSVSALSHALSGGRARAASWLALAAGGVLSIAAGLIVRRALAPDGPGFAKNFSLIFACSAAALTAATFFLTCIRDTGGAHQPIGAKALPTGIANALSAPVMRRFLAFRMALALLAGADPFFMVYAMRELKMPQTEAGVFVAVYAAAMLISAPVWHGLMRRAGNRVALQTVAAIRILAPLVALTLPSVVKSRVYTDHVHNPRVEFYIFAAVFGALGMTARGYSLSGSSYIAELAPARHYDAYAFLANCTLLVAGFTPLIAASIVTANGFQRLFLATTIAGLIAVLSSGLLGETHARARTAARALPSRGARSA